MEYKNDNQFCDGDFECDARIEYEHQGISCAKSHGFKRA